jgi:DNA-directed RNA polymerase subunit E'/Rpb7
MEHSAIFEEQVALTPMDLRQRRGKVESIDGLLQEKLQARLEEKCSRHGYVLPGTIKILSRSMGSLEKGRFTGAVLFHVQAEGRVLNPPDGQLLEGKVIRKNKMGIYVSYQDAIRVIIPRDLHIGDEAFDKVEIGETIRTEVKKSRFQVNDPFILSVGIFRGSVAKATRAATAAAEEAVAPVPVGEETKPEGGEEEGEESGGEESGDEGDEGGEEDEEDVSPENPFAR